MKSNKIKEYKCLICGYIHEGDSPPEACIVCGASGSEFELVMEENVLEIVTSISTQTNNLQIVILGSGIAAIIAAETIREKNSSANITVITKETHLPYYRINLTRYLSGEILKDELFLHTPSWYEKKKIKLIASQESATINKQLQNITLLGEVYPYDKLIIATGSSPFIPKIPGIELGNILSVRSIEDVDTLLQKIAQVKECICIGGGILGLETAAAITKHGVKVSVLESSPWIMARQLNKPASIMLKASKSLESIEFYEGVGIAKIHGSENCEAVELSDGRVINAPLIIVTTGIAPTITLAKEIGLKTAKGIIVNNLLETSDKNIYAVGDAAEHNGVVYGLWNISMFQGQIAGLNALGETHEFLGLPFSHFLKVLDVELFSMGDFVSKVNTDIVKEYSGKDFYYCFTIRDELIVGSVIIGNKKLALLTKKAIENKENALELIANIKV